MTELASAPKSWWGRNWKWAIPVGALSLFLLAAGGLVALVALVFGLIKSSDAYTLALAKARRDPQVLAALGEPVREGCFASGNINLVNDGGSANLAIPLSGPKGSATLRVQATKTAGSWRFDVLQAEVLAGPKIDLLASASLKAPPGAWDGKASGIVAAHRGKILLLLLGRFDCPGTARATRMLDKYAQNCPPDAAIVRVEVPLPNEKLAPPAEWAHAFPYTLDEGRVLATQLEFFYYPTFYVFDRDGALRFTGDCDVTQMPEMVREIAAETPGSRKKIHTLPQPAPGSVAPAFTGTTLDGRTVTLESLRGKRATLLFFGSTACPFSVKALADLKMLADDFDSRGVSVVVINRDGEKGEVAAIYGKAVPGLPVIWDRRREICQSYGVSAVPYFFLLDADGKVLKQRSFTGLAAAGALNAGLGLAVETTRYKPAEGG